MKSSGIFCSGFIEIQTFDGPKWIKDVKVGDLVLTNQRKYKKVTKVIRSELPIDCTDKVYDFCYFIENENNEINEEGLYRISKSAAIQCINGFKRVEEIEVGDLFLCKDKTRVKVQSININEAKEVSRYIYSLEIEDNSTFYANNICIKDRL